jgi:hypothetical protein
MVSMEGAEVVTYPPTPDELAKNSTNLPFSGEVQGIRTPKSELPGGSIALLLLTAMKCKSHPMFWTEYMLLARSRLHSTSEFSGSKTRSLASARVFPSLRWE